LDLILMTVVESDASAVVISHDVGVVARVSDFVLVMHAGHIVERGPVKEVLTKPGHPYTRGLLASVPTVNEKRPIDGIPGQVPLIGSFPTGCRFSERCSFVMERCKERPPDYLVGDDHYSLCWLHEENR
jgi:peptide/nickel transport system ATP-binding protein